MSVCQSATACHAWYPTAVPCRPVDASAPDTGAEEPQIDRSTPYSLQDEWADVTPIDPNAGLPDIVAIQYEACDRETLNYFYAVLSQGELSARVLALTEEVRHRSS